MSKHKPQNPSRRFTVPTIKGKPDDKDIETYLVGHGYTLVKTSRPEMSIVRRTSGNPKVFVSTDQMAKTLAIKIGQALLRPGLNRTSVFKTHIPSQKTIFAYSIDPQDPSRFIREDESGDRTVGRMVNGKFSPILVAH